MENPKKVGSGSSSSTMTNLDHLFGPRDSSSLATSPSTTGIFGSIFPPPTQVPEGVRRQDYEYQAGGSGKRGNTENASRSSKSGSGSNDMYENASSVEPCYFSSSIHYGGQENYSPRTRPAESHYPTFKKDVSDDQDGNGNNSNSASRGNWWQGSLYY